MTQHSWIAVASAEHVGLGRKLGFMQVCHGKAAPLRRVRPGDRVIYYSPSRLFRGEDGLQAFTAMGHVKDGAPYQAAMSDMFHPWRRDVAWLEAKETPIRPMLDRLAFSRDNRNWGYQLRFGLFQIPEEDGDFIQAAMM
jgi:hypothetical protein